MSALDRLKAACMGKTYNKTYKNFDELVIGEHVVHEFVAVETKHGRRVRIQLDTHHMFLPPRFNETLDDAALAELNSSPIVMVYGGKDASQKNRLILDFHDVDYLAQQLFPQQQKLRQKFQQIQ